MKNIVLALVLVLVIIFSLVTGVLFVNWTGTEEGELYTYPLWVEDETHVVTVRTNWTSAPEVSYFGLLKSVDVHFRGTKGTVSCNITVPNDLIWGGISVHLKGYKQSEDKYKITSNSTHNSIQIQFQHIATVVILSVRGTQGIITAPYV